MAMLSYIVRISVDKDATAEWLAYMKDKHVPEVLETGCFNGCIMWRDTEDVERDSFVFQYEVPDRATFDRYVAEHAPRLRKEPMDLFGGRFTASRMILEQEKAFTPPGE